MTDNQHCRTGNGCQVRTKFSTFSYDFSWSIENFPKWLAGTRVRSPEFNPVNNETFYATLERKSDTCYTDAGKTVLMFYLKSETYCLSIKHNVSITDCSGKQIFFETSVDSVYNNSETSCRLFSLVTKELMGYNNLTKDQILVFRCTMDIYKLCTEIGAIHQTATPSDNLSVLVNDLRFMYTLSLQADINLQVEDSVVRVHKSLLCARSPVFAKMFESPMEENEKNAIAIPDIELPILKNLLEFLYTGNLLAEDFESVYDLYYAADKYDVPSLRKTCVGILLSKMDVENSCRVLSLANQHSDIPFKKSAMDYVLFHFNKIVETDSWEKILDEETKLAAEVMRSRSKSVRR